MFFVGSQGEGRKCTVDGIRRLCFNPCVETDAYIALGSNLGDRDLNLLKAVAEIGRLPSGKVTGLSPFYETSPVGVTDQPLFCNAVLRLATGQPPLELLHSLQHIESEVFKRKRDRHWGPRTMDLDLLLYGDCVMDSVELTLPHPRLAERRFVLQPLCDLAPQLAHPRLGRTMVQLLAGLQSAEKVTRI